MDTGDYPMKFDLWFTLFLTLLGIGIAGLLTIFCSDTSAWSRFWRRIVIMLLSFISIAGGAGAIACATGLFPTEPSDHPATNSTINTHNNNGIITQGQTGSNSIGK